VDTLPESTLPVLPVPENTRREDSGDGAFAFMAGELSLIVVTCKSPLLQGFLTGD